MLKNCRFALSALGGISILCGCSASQDTKTTVAAPSRKQPAFVRLLNLSSKSASLVDRGRQMFSPVAANASSSFTTCPSGKRILHLKGTAIDLDVKTDLSPGATALIVVGASGKKASIIDDVRSPQNGHNLQVIYLDTDGALQSWGPLVTIDGAGNKFQLSAANSAVTVSEGRWTMSAPSLVKADPLVVAGDSVYDLVLVKRSNGSYSEIALSHLVIEKAKLAGVSKGK